TGDKEFSFGFGRSKIALSAPGIRFGSGWSQAKKDVYRLHLEVEQNDTTKWRFGYFTFKNGNPVYRKVREFTVNGKGAQTCDDNLGIVRVVIPSPLIVGIQFDCLTPNAQVKVKNLSIVPASAEVFFRRKFDLSEAPVMAKTTFRVCPSYELYINGQKADSGNKVYPSGIQKTLDIQSFLRKGENTIAFSREFRSWADGNPDWHFEGAAVDRDGKLTRLLGDDKWKCSILRQPDWMQPGCDDSAWVNAALTDIPNDDYVRLADGQNAGSGLDPAHMGLLDTVPAERQFPVFTDSEAPSFTVKIPAGLAGKTALSYYVENQDTCVTGKTIPVNPGYIEKAGLAACKVTLDKLPAGPYRIYWRLSASGNLALDERNDEFVVAGPIAQDMIKPADYEQELERRLVLVRSIDCAAAATDDTEFLDHAGMYNPPKLDKGRVVEKDGMAYRETGANAFDYFAYRLHGMKLGEPYLVEILIPDNDIRGVYSGVVEQLPVPFPSNHGDGRRGWFNTTGSCITGKRYPLTGKEQKLRYLYFPCSQAAALVVMNGAGGKTAAATKINIYTLKGGVPGMEMPDGGRMFGTHYERLNQAAVSGNGGNPLLRQFTMDYRRNNWYSWYKICERKIKLLRFQGMNMAVEGAYMYDNGQIPVVRHNNNIAEAVFDPLRLMIQMYRANRIHCMLGFEFVSSPTLQVELDKAGSQRQMQSGKSESIYFLDRSGKPVTNSLGCGINFLHPAVKAACLELLSAIYNNYQADGGVDGLFMIRGAWWTPTFSVLGSIPEEVGYDDLTVGLFEKETGVSLAVNAGAPDRFEQRFKLLTGQHRTQWMQWRAGKVLEFFKEVSTRISAGENKWPLYICDASLHSSPSGGWSGDFFGGYEAFASKSATPANRNNAMEGAFEANNLMLDMYEKLPGIKMIVPNHKQTFAGGNASADFLPMHGWNTNRGTTEVVRKFPRLYPCLDGLNEIDCPATAAKNWLWNMTLRAAFVIRGAGDNASEEFVNMSKTVVPEAIFFAWTDCNWESAGTESMRMFCRSLYATPVADFQELPDDRCRGVSAAQAARTGGAAWLRLVNATPYPLTGWIKAGGKTVGDMVYDKTLNGKQMPVTMKPYSVRIFKCADAEPSVFRCQFALPEKEEAEILALGNMILQQSSLLKKIPAPIVDKIRRYSLNDRDAVKLQDVLNDFEVATHLSGLLDKTAALRQQTMLRQLETGRARINCACDREYTDLDGNLWLPDQSFNGSCYGNEFASFADRGDLAIEGAKCPQIYQTEAYGKQVFYHFPLPDGNYNVYVHIAETYPPNKEQGRVFSVKIGKDARKDINPVIKAGGFARPYVEVWKDVAVKNGILSVEAWGGVGLNGIEIEKAK
ncbi:MAG: malectin domain-containing carbohydrate-binding protein, partial [Victivallales bacterium]